MTPKHRYREIIIENIRTVFPSTQKKKILLYKAIKKNFHFGSTNFCLEISRINFCVIFFFFQFCDMAKFFIISGGLFISLLSLKMQ